MTQHRTTPLVVVASLSLALFAVACGDKSDVGGGLNTDITGKLNELSTTTTVDPNATTTTVVVNNPLATTTTAAKATTVPPTAVKQTTTTQDLSFPVSINGDSSGKNQIDPNQIQVRVNGKVKFTNNDTKVRSIVSQDGQFRSPDLQPGQSWVYTAKTPSSGASGGVFHLTDGTRSYVTATMQVF